MEKCVKICGRVQGVGFRFWAVRAARSVGGISGYICNLSDGDVLVLLSGKAAQVAKMLAFLHQGPLFARVDSVCEAPELKIYFPAVENGVFKRI